MKESLRKIILFVVIVTIGSILILFDVPLIVMIPLIIATGFILLVLFGAISGTEIRALLGKRKLSKGKKTAPEPVKKAPAPGADTKTKESSSRRSFFSSIRFPGSVLRRRSKHEKTTADSEQLPTKDSAIPDPSPDPGSVASDIPKEQEKGELPDLGGLPVPSEPGSGNLLDTKSEVPDSLNPEVVIPEAGMNAAATETATGSSPAAVTPSSAPASAPPTVKPDVIPFDAPLETDKGPEQESIQADMVASAGGGSRDEDLLSSISMDIKHVKKEKNISLLRDLEDFKAPATDIAAELSDLYNRLNAIKKPKNLPGMLQLDPSLYKKNILIVDDDPAITSLIGFMLNEIGCLVAGSASTAQEAIDITKKVGPDLVLMDIHLKGHMDGIEAASTIWGIYNIPVVFVTADAEDDTLQRAIKTTPFGYIEKPLNKETFMLTLKMAFLQYEEEKKQWGLNNTRGGS
ncbi:MAG: response regulator [bacterium]